MFRELTSGEVRDIYNRYMKQDFPPQELKPLKNIERMRERGEYSCYGSFEDGRLKAYAFVAEPRGGGMVLLDYLAAVSDERSAGHGSRMLGFLREACAEKGGILIEAEDPAFAADEADGGIRRRRIRFYDKNGSRDTGVRAVVFATEYVILHLGKELVRPEQILREYETIYRMMVPEPHYSRNIRVSMEK